MRLDQLNFSRFIAAISIVIFHYGIKIFPFNLDATSFLFEQANIGVSYFFFLSGFVMIIAYGNKDKIKYWDYMKNRFARIYPVYFLALALFLGYILVTPREFDLLGMILNALLIQSWVPGKALSGNYPGWSLCVEFFFYSLFPLLFNKFYSVYNYKKLVLPIFIFFALSQIVFHYLFYSSFYTGFLTPSHEFAFYFPVMHLNEFLIGNLAGIFFINNKEKLKRNWDIPIILLIIAVIFLLKYNFGLIYHNGLLAVLFIPLIIFQSGNTGIITKICNNKILVWLGEISYGIYILQEPIYVFSRGLFVKFLKIDSIELRFYFAFILLAAVSAISYKYIEAPLRNKIKNLKIGR